MTEWEKLTLDECLRLYHSEPKAALLQHMHDTWGPQLANMHTSLTEYARETLGAELDLEPPARDVVTQALWDWSDRAAGLLRLALPHLPRDLKVATKRHLACGENPFAATSRSTGGRRVSRPVTRRDH